MSTDFTPFLWNVSYIFSSVSHIVFLLFFLQFFFLDFLTQFSALYTTAFLQFFTQLTEVSLKDFACSHTVFCNLQQSVFQFLIFLL